MASRLDSREMAEPLADDPTLADTRLAGLLLERFERERETLARALHDELGAHLTAIALDVAAAAEGLSAGRARTRLERAQRLVHEAVALQRRLTQSLRPSTIDDLGLVAALQAAVEGFERRTGTICATHFEEPPDTLDRRVALALFRLGQEYLCHLETDGRATRASVALTRGDDALRLTLASDVAPLTGAAAAVHAMRARLLYLGGELAASPGAEGLELVAHAPLVPVR